MNCTSAAHKLAYAIVPEALEEYLQKDFEIHCRHRRDCRRNDRIYAASNSEFGIATEGIGGRKMNKRR
nr:hypothetical protein [Tanacetum cinerariifolium]